MTLTDGILCLRHPQGEMAKSIAAFRQSFLDAGETFINGSQQLHRFENIGPWLDAVHLCQAGPHGPLGVPSTLFLAFREEDGALVGCIDVRHSLTRELRRLGGHIGYSIAPSFRGRGYAVRMLRLALDFARRLGLREVRVDCDTGNIPSRRTILAAGGLLTKEATTLLGGKPVEVSYFRIPL